MAQQLSRGPVGSPFIGKSTTSKWNHNDKEGVETTLPKRSASSASLSPDSFRRVAVVVIGLGLCRFACWPQLTRFANRAGQGSFGALLCNCAILLKDLRLIAPCQSRSAHGHCSDCYQSSCHSVHGDLRVVLRKNISFRRALQYRSDLHLRRGRSRLALPLATPALTTAMGRFGFWILTLSRKMKIVNPLVENNCRRSVTRVLQNHHTGGRNVAAAEQVLLMQLKIVNVLGQ